MLQSTHLKYMDDAYLFYDRSGVLDIFDNPAGDGRKIVILDETILYPQGGGQPYDIGVIQNESGKFIVEEVRFVDGSVYNIGHFEPADKVFSKGDMIEVFVDQDRRLLNSRLQSAGHLVDAALHELGYTDLKPAKGYHFPDGPYVEYIGELSPEKLAALPAILELKINEMVAAGFEVQTMMATKDQIEKMCYVKPEKYPEGKPLRIVTVWKELWMPCGATHVKNISELGKVTIKSVKNKKGNLRVSYQLS